MKKVEKQSIGKNSNTGITRKEALKKVGITGLAATSLFFLSTKSSSAASPPVTPPGDTDTKADTPGRGRDTRGD